VLAVGLLVAAAVVCQRRGERSLDQDIMTGPEQNAIMAPSS
jgi:hypothetical protein